MEIKDVVKNEVMKELNWKERIVVRAFNKTFNKVYNISRINTINAFLR